MILKATLNNYIIYTILSQDGILLLMLVHRLKGHYLFD